MRSSLHWLLFLLVAVIILGPMIFGLLLINHTRARTWIARLSERKSYSTVEETKEETSSATLVREPKEETPSSKLFKLLIYSWLLILTILFFFLRHLETFFGPQGPFYSSKQPSYAELLEFNGLVGLGVLAPPLCFFIAAIIHFRPNHSRLLKYFVLLLPLPLDDLMYLPGELFLGPHAGRSFNFYIECLISFPVTAWGLTLSMVLMIFGIYWLKRTENNTCSFSRYEYTVFHFIRAKWSGLFMLILILVNFKNLLLVLLVVRYIAIERFLQRPIVYLRSFHHQHADQVFGRAIAPALSSYGVIIGLVHNLQTGSRLFSRTSLWQFGWMAVVPDGRWQEWVSAALNQASLAIIDGSVVTESVLWEIRTAVSALDVTRIAVIRGTHDSNCHDFPGVQVFEYSNENSQALRQLKEKLHRWGKIPSRALTTWQVVIAWMFAIIVLLCYCLRAFEVI